MGAMKTPVLAFSALLVAATVSAQDGPSTTSGQAGRPVFVARCAGCHGTDGNGGELGPNIATRVPTRTDQELTTVVRQGLVLNKSQFDLQLLGDDRRLHLLRKSAADAYKPVTSQTDWTSYNGGMSGSRYSTLAQITKGNVSSLAPKWMFSLRNTNNLQVTPIVSEGVMYVTSANECYALDAGSGREIW